MYCPRLYRQHKAENYVPAGSNLIMLNTGYRFQQDLAMSAEYLNAYYESQGQ